MAYTPTTWSDGDVITAEKMNKLEQGVKNEQVGPAGPAGAKGEKGDPGPAGAKGEKAIQGRVTFFQRRIKQRLAV